MDKVLGLDLTDGGYRAHNLSRFDLDGKLSTMMDNLTFPGARPGLAPPNPHVGGSISPLLTLGLTDGAESA